MNKRGQIFLMAALVIAGIIIALTSVSISTKTSSTNNAPFYDLSKEISYESDKLIDYGIYKAKDSGEISTSIISLAANYSAENPDTELTVVYGNATSINSLLFARTSTGTTSLAGAGYSQQSTNLIPVQSWQENGNVIVALDNRTTLSFALQPSGENFFIVLRKTSGGEIIVASSG